MMAMEISDLDSTLGVLDGQPQPPAVELVAAEEPPAAGSAPALAATQASTEAHVEEVMAASSGSRADGTKAASVSSSSEAPSASAITSCVTPGDEVPLPKTEAEMRYLRASLRQLEAENAALGEECGLLMEMVVRKHYKTIAEIKFMCKHSAKAKNIVMKK